MDHDACAVETAAPVVAPLENHRAFLRYLERRGGDRALARPEQLPADEAVVPWFYRTLRNAAIDRLSKGAYMERDVVCGMQVDPAKAAGSSEFNGKTYYFCSKACKAKFDANAAQYAK